MLVIIAAALLVLACLGAFQAIKRTLMLNINGPAFIGQIQKLILVNNIERAIKLCNAAPTAPLARGIKALVCHANRTHELHLAYEEARAELFDLRGKLAQAHGLSLALLLIGNLALCGTLILLGADGPDQPLTVGLCGGFVLALLIWGGVSHALYRATFQWDALLLRVRNLLYHRGNVVPASHQSRPESALSPEDLATWRAATEAFNTAYTARKEAEEEQGTPQEEYDKQADPSGVLPPL